MTAGTTGERTAPGSVDAPGSATRGAGPSPDGSVVHHRHPTRRRVIAILGVAVVLVLLLEGFARIAEDSLPARLVWHSEEAQLKVERMDELQSAGGVDVVFLGSSIVNTGIEPAVFDRDAGGGVTSYNASLNSGIPRLMEPWTLDVVLPRLSPELVVIGVTSADFTDAGAERSAFYDAYLESPGAREAMGTEATLDRAERWMADHSVLWEHRSALRNPSHVLRALRGRELAPSPEAAALQPNGRTAYLQTQAFEDRVRGVGVDLTNWSIGSVDAAAMRRLIAGVESTGARVVLVEMPVTEEYIARHPDGGADYREYRRFLDRFAADADVEVVDDLAGNRDHALFADELHMNVDGATQFTAALTAELQGLGAIPE